MNLNQENLVDNPFSKWDESADVKIPSATAQIYKFIFDTYSQEQSNVMNRASAATMCPKRRLYQKKGTPGTPLTPRKLVNFLIGDIGELVMQYWVKEACVGEGKLYSEVDFGEKTGEFTMNGKVIETYEQEDLEIHLPGVTVIGHADGFGKRNVDGKWELIEFKTAANWGFKSFQQKGAEDYLRQAHTLMLSDKAKSLDIKLVRFFYMRKETGHLWDRVHAFSEVIAKRIIKEFALVESGEEIPTPYPLVPETRYRKPTGRKIAGFPCSYCPYIESCHGKPKKKDFKADQWGNFKPVFVY